MRCTSRLQAGAGLAVAFAAASLGCAGANDDGSANLFDAYVPSATPVVRASVDREVGRIPLQFSDEFIIDLAPTATGNATRYQLATDGHDRVFTFDLIDGDVRGIDRSGAAVVWQGGHGESLHLEPTPLALGADRENLLVASGFPGPGRLRVVAANGEIVEDVEMATTPWRLTGLGDRTFVAQQVETGVVGRYGFDGHEIARYTVFQFPEGELGGDRSLWPQQQFVVGSRRVYAATSETHQVTAFDIDGGSVWVLRGDAERIPIPEHISGRTLGRSRRAGRAAGGTIDTEYAQVKWPEFYPALARIATDAQDRLYVFPYVVEQKPDRYPVDVYDATGALIMYGWLPFQGWDAFGGDSVYRIETRGDSVGVVRYELDLQAAPAPVSAGQ